MATVNRPPFWVPRQGWDDLWHRPPGPPNVMLAFLTKQAIFGQGGQSATRNYVPLYTQDDPPMWQGAPSKSYIAYNNINFTQLRGPGEVLQYNWSGQIGEYDDPPMWQGMPQIAQAIRYGILQALYFSAHGKALDELFFSTSFDDSAYWQGQPTGARSMQNLVQQKIYGAGGQVAPIKYAPFYVQDDPPPWYPPIDNLNSDILFILTKQVEFGQGGQVPTFRPNFTYDDPSYWTGAPIEVNGSLYKVTAQAPPFLAPVYVPRPGDDQREWQGKQTASWQLPALTSQTFYGAPGQVSTFRPNFTYDDASYWWETAQPANTALANPQGPRPLSIYNNVNYYSEDAFWLGTPSRSVLLPILSGVGPVAAPVYVTRPDESSGLWQGKPYKNTTQFPATQVTFYGQAGQGYPYRPRFDADESPPWYPPLEYLNSSTVTTLVQQASVMPPAILWAPEEVGEPAVTMKAPPQVSQLLLALPPVPPRYVNTTAPYVINYFDDPSVWRAAPVSNDTLFGFTGTKLFGQGGQSLPFRWNFTVNDPPEFQGTPLPAYSLITLGSTITGRVGIGERPFTYLLLSDDSSVWFQQTPMQNYVVTNTKTVYPPGTTVAGLFTLRWPMSPFNFDVGEAPGWVGAPIGQVYQMTQPGPPVPVNVAQFTVSGQDVALTFQEFFSGVSYTDAPIPKRTE